MSSTSNNIILYIFSNGATFAQSKQKHRHTRNASLFLVNKKLLEVVAALSGLLIVITLIQKVSLVRGDWGAVAKWRCISSPPLTLTTLPSFQGGNLQKLLEKKRFYLSSLEESSQPPRVAQLQETIKWKLCLHSHKKLWRCHRTVTRAQNE